MMTLKAARINKDLTQKKAANLIGVNVSTLSKWEKEFLPYLTCMGLVMTK